MSMGLLLLILGGLIALLCLWAFWLAPRLGPRLDHAQKGAMIAFQMVTALAILSAGILYLDEQQWSPRLAVELKADPRLVPDSNPESAVVQLAIGVTNMTETNQTVNFIDIAAFGIRGTPRRESPLSEDLAATQLYRYVTSRPSDVGPDETYYKFVEIPVPCEWSLVRIAVKVPRPPAHPPGKPRFEYQRKLLVPIAEVCGHAAAQG